MTCNREVLLYDLTVVLVLYGGGGYSVVARGGRLHLREGDDTRRNGGARCGRPCGLFGQ